MTRRKTEHVTIGDNSLRCLNCGNEFAMPMPVSINMFAAMGKAFQSDHADCKPAAKGAAKTNATDAFAWIDSWDTGASSKTIWRYMMHGSTHRVDIPYDPADFGRCYRLLAIVPEWEPRLAEMGERIPQWKPFADAWPQMKALYEEESKREDGRAPRLYALMSRLVEQSRSLQP